MDLWQRARGFAQEAARKSQELSKGAAELVSETAKRSKELAAEASKKAEVLRAEAVRRADQIKTLAGDIDKISVPAPIAQGAALLRGVGEAEEKGPGDEELTRFGVTEELREFVKGVTISTFKDFPMQEEPEISDAPAVSNVRQDLNEWQAKHATLVLSTVKEISKFRYELCPRYMKERKFWRIYFILVDSYVVQYEKKYIEESKLKAALQEQKEKVQENSSPASTSKTQVPESKPQDKASKSATADHDLDVFLLGDLGDSDEGPDEQDDTFDDDFDKVDDSMALDSDDNEEKKSGK